MPLTDRSFPPRGQFSVLTKGCPWGPSTHYELGSPTSCAGPWRGPSCARASVLGFLWPRHI